MYDNQRYVSIVITVINKPDSARRRGRPPSFDRQTVLDQAMLLFWKQGYEGTSIADLTAAMGITPQSLYAAFGSKSALYREVLDHFQRTVAVFTTRALDEEDSALKGFERILRESAAQLCKPKRPRGCMISTGSLTCAMENQDQVRYVSELRKASVTAFRNRIVRAIEAGEFKPTTDADALARYLATIVHGMSIEAQDGATKAQLLAVAELTIHTLKEAATS